jgi:broad specificity phosphatase PhoE
MPARLLLMRHAETATPRIFHGAESDIGLSEYGVETSNCVASYFASLRLDGVVSSAMRRAVDTATPIAAACRVALRQERQLHERRIGELSGTPTDADHPFRTETLQNWMTGNTAFASPGAESFDDVRDRAVPVLNRLALEFDNRTALIVAHGATIKISLLSILPGWSSADWGKLGLIRNLAVTVLVHDKGEWRAEQIAQVPPIIATS